MPHHAHRSSIREWLPQRRAPSGPQTEEHMRFELVQERVAALPREFPAGPAILPPIRLDSVDEAPAAKSDALRRGRPAAVLVLLFPDDEGQARVLLTARVAHISTHAGEVSFPGGSADPEDDDPVATALREARSEEHTSE